MFISLIIALVSRTSLTFPPLWRFLFLNKWLFSPILRILKKANFNNLSDFLFLKYKEIYCKKYFGIRFFNLSTLNKEIKRALAVFLLIFCQTGIIFAVGCKHTFFCTA